MTKKLTLFDKIFNIFFIAYVVCVFCFNDNANALIFIYLTMIASCGMAFVSLLNKGTRLKLKTELVMLVLYLAYGYIVSMKAVYSVDIALAKTKTIAFCVISTLIMCHYFIERKNIDVLPLALVIAGTVLSVYVVAKYGGFGEFYRQSTKEGARLGGEIANENSIGMQAAYAVVVCLWYMLQKRRYYMGAFAVLPFIVAMSSGSRKALLIIILGVVLLVIFGSNKKSMATTKIAKIAFGLVVFLIAAYFLTKLPIMSSVLERMKNLFNLFKGESGGRSADLRSRMIKAGFRAFPEHPWFGVGFNNASFINYRYTGYFVYLHNDFIEQLVNLGVFGFILYYGNILNIFRKQFVTLKKGNREVLLPFIFLCIIMFNCIGYVAYTSKLTYIFFIYWISSIYITREDNGND